MTRVAVERELRDDEYRAADVGDRPSHLPSFVIEDAEPGDLRRETLAVLRAIVGGNAQEHDEAAVDPRDTLVADVDRGRAHALHDGAQLADHSSIQGLSPRTTAATSSALRWPGVKTVMLFSIGSRVMYVTLPKR